METPSKNKFIIVLGHESSGTRLVAEALACASGFSYDDGEHRTDEHGRLLDSYLTKTIHRWWENPGEIVCDQSRITRRSLPHGGLDEAELKHALGELSRGRYFPNPLPFIEGLKKAGYDVYVVLTVRDRSIAIQSKARTHTHGDIEIAATEMDTALCIMKSVMERHDKCLIFCYEAFMSLGESYMQQLYSFAGIQSRYIPRLADGNTKYVKVLPPKVTIGVVTRQDEHKWGGDLRALNSVKEGLAAQGLDVRVGRTPSELLDCDFVFISNTCDDQRPNAQILSERNVPFALLGFHEDFLAYYAVSMGFTEYISMCMQDMEDNGIKLRIEDLWENPQLFNYYNHNVPKNILYNIPVLRAATFCLAASYVEARTMKRDCPACRTEVVLWDIPLLGGTAEESDEFLGLTGLKSGEYILQVGRLETRKNQLASVLSTKDLDMPLVFIATKGYQDWYDLLVVNAAAKYRKAPTFLVSEQYPSQKVGGEARIIQMPGGQRLSESCLVGAYRHCGLHIHPAFWESPGYTYLEAAKIGVHTVASEWGALPDYCEFGGNDRYMKDRFTYVCPYHLPKMEEAVRQNFGRKVDKTYAHSIFDRTKSDVGKEILQCLIKYRYGRDTKKPELA